MDFFYKVFIRTGILKAFAQTFSTAIVWLMIGSYLFDPLNFVNPFEGFFAIGVGMAMTYTIWHWSWSFSLSPDQKLKRSDSSAEAMALLIKHLTEDERLALRDRLVYSAYDDGEILSVAKEDHRSGRYG